jgi:hypothetical protein
MSAGKSISWQQGYDHGFSDAICGEDNAFSYAETDGERDWMDGYYQGHVAGESSLLDDHGGR